MAIDTALRSPASGALAVRPGVASGTSVTLAPARALERVDGDKSDTAAASTPAPAPLRSSASTSLGGALQDQVARAQQALDYLERVAGQLENLKGEISAKLSGGQSGQRASQRAGQGNGARGQALDTQVRQLAATLAARKSSAGGGVDANLDFSGEAATQRFRIRGLDLDSLQQNAPQTLAFSIGGVGGPQLAATITPDQSKQDAVRAIDRAVAPLGVRAGLDGQGVVFSTPEANWPAVQDSIAVSGRGRVSADEVAPSLAPQQWNIGAATGGAGGNADALRQSLREVVQALERVRRSQDAASNALSSASAQVSAASTPPPDVEIAAEDFASAASTSNYDTLLALSSALVGVSRERVLALLGLR